MRALIDILSGYEGALQEVNDDHSEENLEAVELARAELLEVLQIALKWERAGGKEIVLSKSDTVVDKKE